MFKNALVGVDGRPTGRDAIALAGQLIDHDGKLTLVHVHHGELAEELEDSHKLLEQARAEADVSAELLSIVSTSPGRGLHEQAEELGADLLVVGSCGHSTFGRAMLGDDTRDALNGTPCAVAIAARGYSAHPTAIASVGVAYNDSPESAAALASARELAAASGAKVKALEVVSIPAVAYGGLMAPAIGDSINTMVDEANARLAQLPGVEGRAVYGLTGEELAAFGDELDILVVGSRGYGPLRRLVLGSTSNYLERHARCSLLVLPRV
ncbi:MAG: universal stress protein [Solirubrobacteraceae bacterium]|jgi:nucleotide-binding universal stress UspA family protein